MTLYTYQHIRNEIIIVVFNETGDLYMYMEMERSTCVVVAAPFALESYDNFVHSSNV